MTITPAEVGRRTLSRVTGHLHSLPILALNVHTACNCRCVMCDIWKANANKRELSAADLDRHLEAIQRLHVQRVMLTGGEPLMHRNLWSLCDRLREAGIQITLVTTGLLIERDADDIARTIDHVVVSIDGPPAIHDAVRNVPGGFRKIERGVGALTARSSRPHITARSVVQKANHARLVDTIRAVEAIGTDQVSFLAADVTSTAFNRPTPWSAERQSEITLTAEEMRALAGAIDAVESQCADALATGFIAGGIPSLRRIHAYYYALAGFAEFPPVRCNAPWISAVLEADGRVRPCFFHAAYPLLDSVDLEGMLNAPSARAFRQDLDMQQNEICKRCVCTLSVPVWKGV